MAWLALSSAGVVLLAAFEPPDEKQRSEAIGPMEKLPEPLRRACETGWQRRG